MRQARKETMEDYFKGLKFEEKKVFNIAINRMKEDGFDTYCVQSAAIECNRALKDYESATHMHGFVRALMYAMSASNNDDATKAYSDAYLAMVHFKYYHID